MSSGPVLVLALALAVAVCAPAVHAQGAGGVRSFPYPPVSNATTIQFISPLDLTGGTGTIAQVQQRYLQSLFNISVVLSTRTGDSGITGVARVAGDPADGLWWTMIQLPNVIAQPLKVPGANFSCCRDSFTVVYVHSYTPVIVIVNEQSALNSWEQFVALCRANATACVAGGPAVWSAYHLCILRLSRAYSIDIKFIGKTGFSDTYAALLTGEIAIGVVANAAVQSSTVIVRPLALASDYPFPQFPDTPTFTQLLGYSFSEGLYRGVVVPPNTPADVCRNVSRLVDAMQRHTRYINAMTEVGAVLTFLPYGPKLDAFLDTQIATVNALLFPPQPLLDVVADGAVTGVLVLGATGLLACVGLGLTLVRWWEHVVYRASSRLFNVMIVAGYSVAYILMLVLAHTQPTSVFGERDASAARDSRSTSCAAYPWLLCLSFDLIYVPLLAKKYRLYSIFIGDALNKRSKLTDAYITAHVAVVIAVDVVVLTAWTALDPLRVVDTHPVLNASGTYVYTQTCASDVHATGEAFIAVLLALKAVVLAVGLWLAFRLRNVSSVFNESRAIAFSTYNLCLVLVLVALLTTQSRNSAQTDFLLVTCGIWLATSASLVALFVPKLYALTLPEAEIVAAVRSTPTRPSKPSRPHTTGSGGAGDVSREQSISRKMGATLITTGGGGGGSASPNSPPPPAHTAHTLTASPVAGSGSGSSADRIQLSSVALGVEPVALDGRGTISGGSGMGAAGGRTLSVAEVLSAFRALPASDQSVVQRVVNASVSSAAAAAPASSASASLAGDGDLNAYNRSNSIALPPPPPAAAVDGGAEDRAPTGDRL